MDVTDIPPIPAETSRRAHAVFGSSNFYLRLGDQLPAMLQETPSQALCGAASFGTWAVPLHALVTCFQLIEELSDVQASDALRTRIDWQYALHLPPTHPNVHEEELCAYRQLLLADASRKQAFHDLANRLVQLGGFCGWRTCSADAVNGEHPLEPLAAVCMLNRLTWALQAMRDLLGVLAARRAGWLNGVARAHWYTSYWSDRPLLWAPACCAPREQVAAVARMLGDDIRYLLEALAGLPALDAVEAAGITRLRRVWRQQYVTSRERQSALRPHCSFCSQAGVAQVEEGA